MHVGATSKSFLVVWIFVCVSAAMSFKRNDSDGRLLTKKLVTNNRLTNCS